MHLQVGLLSVVGGEEIHQRRGEGVVGVEPDGLELGADLVHLVGVEALLDDGGDEAGELGLLVAAAGEELGVDEVEAAEGVGLLDAAEEVDAAVTAGVALDDGGGVDDLELVLVGGHGDVLAGEDADDGEEGAGGLPALGAAAGVVVGDVALEVDGDFVGRALALEGAAGEVGVASGQPVVDEGVDVERHICG